MQASIGIIGAGAWGTALAVLWANAGRSVLLYTRSLEHARQITARRENAAYLPGIALPESVIVTDSLEQAGACGLLALTMPAQAERDTLVKLREYYPDLHTPLLLCSKGIELATGLLMTEVAAEIYPHAPLAVLSGPNFAGEVARGLPTASVIACTHTDRRNDLAAFLSTPTFRLYGTEDVIGAEVAGAVKNVLAIACGIAYGRGLGENARAAIITRGLAEIKRLAIARGAKSETLAGLSGLGDITLTCSSPTSRNMSFGAALGQGQGAQSILAQRQSVVEGVPTAGAVLALAEHLKIEMPICAAVHDVITGRIQVEAAIRTLLERPLRQE